MSAILSASDLNDFISPGVACIKPIETLPTKQDDPSNPYEVTTEDKVAASNPPPAQISLTDCLACSGCVTSAEAVLVSLQSHTEVLNTLDAHPSLPPPWLRQGGATNGWHDHSGINGHVNGEGLSESEGKIFIASISPQVRASLAATYNVSSTVAGNMIAQLLSAPHGLAAGGTHRSSFLWVLDTNRLRDLTLVLAADEVAQSSRASSAPKTPVLTSACPGWICYAEKQHTHILPHLSRLKSPQAMAGTLLKSVLSKKYGVPPEKVWHLAVMPCFDKKLEASRGELTSDSWLGDGGVVGGEKGKGVRDVDCVITARELVALAEARGINFASLPRTSLPRRQRVPFPDPVLDRFLFPPPRRRGISANSEPSAGTSGGYLWHILQSQKARYPGSRVRIERGRNADVVEYLLVRSHPEDGREEVLFKAARYYGFRNIQNLVRKLRPPRTSRLLAAAAAKGAGARRPNGASVDGAAAKEGHGLDYAYVEVMACPGGCTNGGGQIRVDEAVSMNAVERELKSSGGVVKRPGPMQQREWLGVVDEAYFSASDSSSADEDSGDEGEGDEASNGDRMDIDVVDGECDVVDGISRSYIHRILEWWRSLTNVDMEKLVFTTYTAVESDVGKEKKKSDVERVAGLASSIGGGW